MATEVSTGRPRAESHTLRAEEERLRAHLEQRLRVQTRFAPLADVRALLVSREGRPRSLVVSSQASVAERIYLYVHVAAHIALGHDLPLVTIVEGTPGVTRFSDASRHREAEELARAIWWGQTDKGGLLGAPASVQRSAMLRRLLASETARGALRSLLIGMRHVYYDLRVERALAGSRVAAWLRDALCVTAVVSVAPQLSD
ncbi:MAG TPA: hypothetical protein VGR85_00550 [Candidatus Limnocylindria bacterium]|jgi:hypothetical protein|nr:hypothetical protein [Candidatus Limnocylindria bacterium]